MMIDRDIITEAKEELHKLMKTVELDELISDILRYLLIISKDPKLEQANKFHIELLQKRAILCDIISNQVREILSYENRLFYIALQEYYGVDSMKELVDHIPVKDRKHLEEIFGKAIITDGIFWASDIINERSCQYEATPKRDEYSEMEDPE